MAIDAKWTDFSGLDRERLLANLNQRLPKWVALLLVIAIAWQLARIVWMLVPGSPTDDAITVSPGERRAAAAADARTDGVDVEAIAAAHLFGEAGSDAPPPRETVAELAETRLNLSLKGTLAADDAGQSIAIIADTRNEEKIYSIDDTVVPGTTPHAVYTDRVVLNRSGVLEVLRLPQDFPPSSQPVRRAAPAVSRTTEANPSIQEVVSANATKLADLIRPTPYFVAGQQQGYRVYPGRDRRQFAALGLRPGDLIKEIDGAALTDPQQAMQIFQNLGSADQVSVTVERNGQPEVLVLSTSQLELDDDQ
jgi:general secretion pathway protein C